MLPGISWDLLHREASDAGYRRVLTRTAFITPSFDSQAGHCSASVCLQVICDAGQGGMVLVGRCPVLLNAAILLLHGAETSTRQRMVMPGVLQRHMAVVCT
jgi:hypothetical protein